MCVCVVCVGVCACNKRVGISSDVGKDTEVDVTGRQFELDLAAGCVCTAAPLGCGLGCYSRRVEVNNAAAYKRPTCIHITSSEAKYCPLSTPLLSSEARPASSGPTIRSTHPEMINLFGTTPTSAVAYPRPSSIPQEYDGRTALHYAAANGSVDVVRTLLKAGADKDARDVSGKSGPDSGRDTGVALQVCWSVLEG